MLNHFQNRDCTMICTRIFRLGWMLVSLTEYHSGGNAATFMAAHDSCESVIECLFVHRTIIIG
jgi:hypothetical protein